MGKFAFLAISISLTFKVCLVCLFLFFGQFFIQGNIHNHGRNFSIIIQGHCSFCISELLHRNILFFIEKHVGMANLSSYEIICILCLTEWESNI